MKLHTLNRKVHYWISIAVALPALVILCTGILLQTKKQFAWVQPPELRGSGREPALEFSRVLEICKNVPQLEAREWADINRIDVRPSRGMLKIWAKNNWEVQIDIATGQVLQVAYRRSDMIEAIHDGSWFHDSVKLWVFLPAGIALLVLWITGLYLFWLPIFVRRRQKAQKERLANQAATTGSGIGAKD
jgi:uncharacterized iron-regulated membrane protein